MNDADRAAAQPPRDGTDHGFEFTAMATACRVRIAGMSLAHAEPAARAAIAEVRRIEAKYSRYRADSVTARINAAAGSGRAIEVDDETAGLLDFAAVLHEHSGGRFDLSSGALRRVWDFKTARLPAAAELAAALDCVGWQRLRWQRPALELPQPGMELDFGGIGKEYAADRAAAMLAEQGVASGFVNLGGDIRVVGPRPEGRPWAMAIADPRQAAAVIASVELTGGALATSGDYEKYFEQDGRRYCHVLDARTGWPVAHWRSISVIAPACLAAGALSTTAMLLQEQALAFLDAQGVGYLAVDLAGRLWRRDA